MSGSRRAGIRRIYLGGVIVGFCAAVASPVLADATDKAGTNASEPPDVVAVPPAPPPPVPARLAPPLPAPMILEKAQRGDRGSGNFDVTPVVLDVAVAKGRERLLTDSLTVGGGQGGSINRSKSQYRSSCPGDDETSRSMRVLNESLRLTIYPAKYRSSDAHMFRISLSLQVPQGDCASTGSNSLGIERSLVLDPGQSQILEGPDGLTLRISRRN